MPNDIDDRARRLLKITVGVMGSAGGHLSEAAVRMATEMGRVIAARGCVLVTGACPGLPHYAVLGAKSAGGIVVGISPALNFEEHCIKYHSPYAAYDMLVYTGSGLMGREIENIRSCDMVVFMGGRSGTLGEFAIAYDEAKVIGVLKGTGGITDRIETIRLKVSAILPDAGLGGFGLLPSQQLPFIAFIPLQMLQRQMKQQGNLGIDPGATGVVGVARTDPGDARLPSHRDGRAGENESGKASQRRHDDPLAPSFHGVVLPSRSG